jgi:hypothetical protein
MVLQWKPHDVITLGRSQSANINRMITISGLLLKQSTKVTFIWDIIILCQLDYINRMITLYVITLSGFHCTNDVIIWFK